MDAKLQTVLVLANVQVPEPIFKVLAVLPVIDADPAVTLYVTASNVPLVSDSNLAELSVKASAS